VNINGAFPSSYLKAADLQDKRVQVVIAGVTIEEIGDGEHKPVVKFQGKDKRLVLNKTNSSTICEITGTEETDEWPGTKIVLYPTKVDYQGKRVDGIRVDYPKDRPKPVELDDADEMPF
jgi:hypothetical protein